MSSCVTIVVKGSGPMRRMLANQLSVKSMNAAFVVVSRITFLEVLKGFSDL